MTNTTNNLDRIAQAAETMKHDPKALANLASIRAMIERQQARAASK